MRSKVIFFAVVVMLFQLITMEVDALGLGRDDSSVAAGRGVFRRDLEFSYDEPHRLQRDATSFLDLLLNRHKRQEEENEEGREGGDEEGEDKKQEESDEEQASQEDEEIQPGEPEEDAEDEPQPPEEGSETKR